MNNNDTRTAEGKDTMKIGEALWGKEKHEANSMRGLIGTIENLDDEHDEIFVCYAGESDMHPLPIDTLKRLVAENAAANDERDRYKKALEHYADEGNWDFHYLGDCDDKSEERDLYTGEINGEFVDGSAVARKALTEAAAGGGENDER